MKIKISKILGDLSSVTCPKIFCCTFSHQSHCMRRSEFLQTAATVVGASLLPEINFAEENKKSKIRFAHLTDIHVKPGIIPETGMAKAFQHAQSLKPKIDFIINGGDSIMDALEADKQKTQTQWDL